MPVHIDISALHGPCFGSMPGPSRGPGLYIISRAGPGLGLHIAGPGRAWDEKKLTHRAWAGPSVSGPGRAGPGRAGPGLDIIKIFIQNPDYYFLFNGKVPTCLKHLPGWAEIEGYLLWVNFLKGT